MTGQDDAETDGAASISTPGGTDGSGDDMAKRGGGETVADWIVRELRDRGWSQRQLARRTGLAVGAVNDLINRPGRAPRPSTMEKLEGALGPWQGGSPGPSPAGFRRVSPQDLDLDVPSGALSGILQLADSNPDRWVIALDAGSQDGWPFDAQGAHLVLIDREASLENGALVAVDSPRGAGLRYLVDPFLVGGRGPGEVMGHDIRGAEGVTIWGRVALRILIP